jgi:IS30 family transposase
MGTFCHKFKHLSIGEREEIAIMNLKGLSASRIAVEVGRDRSTIFRELKRHRYKAEYRATTAQGRADRLKENSGRHKKATDPMLMQDMERLIKRRWSPEIIAHELGGKISHTTIYSIIRTIRPEWRKYLIYQKKSKYHKGKAGKAMIPDRTDISGRPDVAFGDFEADTVISAKGGKACLGVFVERTTRLYRIVRMADKSSEEMVSAAQKALAGIPVRSITYDNGKENMKHGVINGLLGCVSWFCRPYRSTDKALVENRNKILRQYLPKKTNFDLISQEQLSIIQNEINERPLKCLNWLAPNQAFKNSLPLHLFL